MRRLVIILVSATLAGAILTCGVSFVCALWSPISRQPFINKPETSHEIGPYLDRWPPEGDNYKMGRIGLHGFGADHVGVVVQEFSGPPGNLPYRSAEGLITRSRSRVTYGLIVRFGWPFPAFEGAWVSGELAGDRTFINATDLTHWWGVSRRRIFPEHLVAWGPLAPGIIGDTIFFAALVLGFYYGPGRARRCIRRGRGRCIHCGYDRRGALDGPCPECGRLASVVTPP